MDFTDSGFYIAIAGLSFILWAVGMVLGASVVPVAFGVALIIESRRSRRRRAAMMEVLEPAEDSVTGTPEAAETTPPGEPEPVARVPLVPRALQRADLRSKVAIVALAMPVAVLLAMSVFAYYWVWVLFGVSSVVCAMLWLQLRRECVQYAEVYAIAAWFMPRVVWGVFVLVRAAVSGDDLYDFFLQEPSAADSMLSDIFGGPLVFAVVLVGTIWAVGTAVTAALRDDAGMRPLAMVTLAIPCAVYFWFVEPFGFGHAGLTLMVVGYAISREMRRKAGLHDGAALSAMPTVHAPQSESAIALPLSRTDAVLIGVAAALAVAIVTLVGQLDGANSEVVSIVGWVIIGTAAATAAGVVYARGRAGRAPFVGMMTALLAIAASVLVRDVPAMLGTDFWVDNSFNFLLFVLIQVLAAGTVGILALVATIIRGAHLRYGAVALGIGALSILTWAFDVADFDSELVAWTFTQWFGATIAVCVAIWAIWHLFGPGAVQPVERVGQGTDAAQSWRAGLRRLMR